MRKKRRGLASGLRWPPLACRSRWMKLRQPDAARSSASVEGSDLRTRGTRPEGDAGRITAPGMGVCRKLQPPSFDPHSPSRSGGMPIATPRFRSTCSTVARSNSYGQVAPVRAARARPRATKICARARAASIQRSSVPSMAGSETKVSYCSGSGRVSRASPPRGREPAFA